MGLRYAVKERVFNFDETKTKKYVAAPVSDGVIDFSKLCKNVSLICSTHCGQVKLVLDGLLDSLEGYMDEGKTTPWVMGGFPSGYETKAAADFQGYFSGEYTFDEMVEHLKADFKDLKK